MNAETNKIKARLASLNASFSELESLLDPLFAQSLPETLVSLEPLQQAKLQTVLPYLVYDLIFIYLKSRGIDPKTHPVVPELDRIRGYFEKISSAENPPTKRTELDKAAASRFIKHAISQAQTQWKKTAAEDAQDDDTAAAAPSSSSTANRVPVKITSKMRARAEYEAEVRRADEAGEEESDLVVVDGEEDEDEESTKMDVDVDDEVGLTNSKSKSKSKGKGKETSTTTTTTTTSNKRRRPAIDHFAGYGDDAPQPSLSTEPSKKAKSSPETSSSPPESTAPSPALGESDRSKSSSSSNKKSKKKAKKAAAAAASSS